MNFSIARVTKSLPNEPSFQAAHHDSPVFGGHQFKRLGSNDTNKPWLGVVEVALLSAEPSSSTWLEEVYSLVRRDQIDDALDLAFEKLESLYNEQKFDLADAVTKAIDLKRLDTNLLVGFLSITKRAADKLPSRRQFVQRVERHLRGVAPARVEELLAGLR